MRREEVHLPIARRPVAVEVETGFADGDHLGFAGEFLNRREVFVSRASRLMRVDPHRGADARRMAAGDVDRASAGLDGIAHLEDRGHAPLPTAGDHGLAVGVEVRMGEMAMGIDHVVWGRASRAARRNGAQRGG